MLFGALVEQKQDKCGGGRGTVNPLFLSVRYLVLFQICTRSAPFIIS